VSGIIQGLADLLGRVGDKLDDIKGKISSVAKSALGWAAAIGSGIISGVISGLSGLAGDVASYLIGQIKDGIDRAKAFFHIKSPSLVMAKEVGEPLGEGVILGIKNALGGVGKALSTIDRGGVVPAVSTSPGGRTQLEPALASAPAGGIAVTVNNYAPISSERDFEDMVVNALGGKLGRQGFTGV
jgi:hypothetical protein